MQRRKYLSIISATASTLAIAGCSGDSGDSGGDLGSSDDCTIEQSLEGTEPVPTTVEGRLDSATIELDLLWNARTQNAISFADSPFGHESDEDSKFLIFRFNISNPSEETVSISNTNFDMRIDTQDTTEEMGPMLTSAGDAPQLGSLDIKPDGTIESQLYFEVPSEATQATMIVSDTPYDSDEDIIPAFNPECNRELAFLGLSTGSPTPSAEGDSEETSEDDTTQNQQESSNTEEARRKAAVDNWWGDNGNLVITSYETGADGNPRTVDITGIVNNISENEYDYVQIEFAAYDQSGARIADVFDNTSGLSAGGRWRFDAVGYVDNSSNVASLQFEGFSGF